MSRVRLASAALVLMLATVGCGMPTLQDVPLPGLVDGPTYTVTAVFKNVLGLPQQAPVKMNGTTIGEVGDIETSNYTALVHLKLTQRVPVPGNVRAEVALSSPMGSAYVQLTVPPGAASAQTLVAGSQIGLSATSQAPTVSDLLTAASTVLTGGNFADVKVIITELNTVMRGNSGPIRTVIERTSGMLTRLNQHTAQFDQALTALNGLSKDLVSDRDLLGKSLATLAPAINTLASERQQIFALMDQLRGMSTTAAASMSRSRADLLSIVRDLGPVLETLSHNEANFRAILKGIGDFGSATDTATRGAFLNFNLTMLADAQTLSLIGAPASIATKAAKP